MVPATTRHTLPKDGKTIKMLLSQREDVVYAQNNSVVYA